MSCTRCAGTGQVEQWEMIQGTDGMRRIDDCVCPECKGDPEYRRPKLAPTFTWPRFAHEVAKC